MGPACSLPMSVPTHGISRSAVPTSSESRQPNVALTQSLAQRLVALVELISPLHLVTIAVLAGTLLRLWRIVAVGYNSDEAVYAGQAASLVNDPEISKHFPLVRAHPMLYQFVLALVYQAGVNDLAGRLLSVLFGILAVLVIFLVGRIMYTAWTGATAALLLALMPYHVVVTRQVLLDGPLTFFATLTLYLVAKYAVTSSPRWLWATGAGMGLTFLAKETGLILVAAIYAFLALNSGVRVRIRDLIIASTILGIIVLSFPLSLALAGGGASEKARGYLVWQLLRSPNHEWTFYPATVPPAVGLLVVGTALAGLWWLRREHSWRETLLISWIAVPVVFFQLWPVKGFQYLLPVAPCVALLSARALCRWVPPARSWARWDQIRRTLPSVLVVLVAVSLAIPSWTSVEAVPTDQLLAGSGGVPGGRETGDWIRDNVPEGAVFLTVGPSMANLIEFYGHRPAYGLSVSPNPLARNPSYDAVLNPDRSIRTGEMQYLVYDVYSASRSPHFGDRLLEFAQRYNGTVVHTEYVQVTSGDGTVNNVPVIIVFEVRP